MSNISEQEYKRALALRAEMAPHLYRMKNYPWQREFLECRKRVQLLSAANQIGKSTINMRKAIHWATEPSLWPKLWPKARQDEINLFWYLYPTQKYIQEEVILKWKPLLVLDDPRNRYYCEIKKEDGKLDRLEFPHTGMRIAFKSYGQRDEGLKARTVYSVFADEEMPPLVYHEIMVRTNASDGYFHLVMTPGKGDQMWYNAFEMIGTNAETFTGTDVWKKKISLFDCLQFEDGDRNTPWNNEDKIKRAFLACAGNKDEINRRIFGGFVKGTGIAYHAFSTDLVIKPHPLPDGWQIYSAVDMGAGGPKCDPAAIIFIAVSPCMKKGRVIRCWRAPQHGKEWSVNNVAEKYLEMRNSIKAEFGMLPVQEVYDPAAKDYGLVCRDLGLAVWAANVKKKDDAIQRINVLFKTAMLQVFRYEDDPEVDKLIHEMRSVPAEIKPNNKGDDLADALRMCCSAIGWDFEEALKEVDVDKALGLGIAKKEKREEVRDDFSDDPWVRKQEEAMLKKGFSIDGRIVSYDSKTRGDWDNWEMDAVHRQHMEEDRLCS